MNKPTKKELYDRITVLTNLIVRNYGAISTSPDLSSSDIIILSEINTPASIVEEDPNG